MITNSEPLLECVDAWKSAQDHPEIVRSLIQEEIDAGFIAHVPGGIPEPKQQYARRAVGKAWCGDCIWEIPGTRLVVDS